MDLREGQDIFFYNFLQDHEETVNEKVSNIQEFYENVTIFVTGATGFLGQMLIEKLLRSTKVKKIYAMIRPKDGKTPQGRLNGILHSTLFTAVSNCRENFESVVEVIPGDCCLTNLGLSDNNRKLLIREVDVVFHLASSSAWDDNFKDHVSVNVRGTKWLVELVNDMRHIKAFVYVSTAFGTDRVNRIEERVYVCGKWNFQNLMTIVELLDDEDLKLLEKSIWDGCPNPHIFTKLVAESLIKDSVCDVPVGIFRPSLLVSSAFEPLVGWLANATGVQKISHLGLNGLLRIFYAREHCKADIVPVDLAVNGVLALAWSIGNKWCDGPNVENVQHAVKMEPSVMNFTSGRVNPITWGHFIKMCLTFGRAFPKLADYSFPSITIHDNLLLLAFCQLFFQTLPSIFSDAIRYVTGQQTIWMNFYKNLDKFSKQFGVFTTQQWTFQDKSATELWAKLDNVDRILFNFNLESIDWNDFLKVYVRGIRIYFVKEDISTLSMAKRRMVWFRILFYTGRIIPLIFLSTVIFYYKFM